jgi:cephalosporin hydroxylase
MKVSIDTEQQRLTVDDGDGERELELYSPEAFSALSRLWVTSGWELKYTYGFAWMGRPIIQLPEDLLVIQEVIYKVKPDVVIETGVAHGGSLIFYASLLKAMERGRVVGVDIEIRPHNRSAIEAHELASMITLIEGSSVADDIVGAVRSQIAHGDTVLVLLDSNHTKAHVLAELDAYAPLVTSGSYIVATDGVMEWLTEVPRRGADWGTDNPKAAVEEWLPDHPEFTLEDPPPFTFNEGVITERITHWPSAYLRRT